MTGLRETLVPLIHEMYVDGTLEPGSTTTLSEIVDRILAIPAWRDVDDALRANGPVTGLLAELRAARDQREPLFRSPSDRGIRAAMMGTWADALTIVERHFAEGETASIGLARFLVDIGYPLDMTFTNPEGGPMLPPPAVLDQIAVIHATEGDMNLDEARDWLADELGIPAWTVTP